MNREILFKAKRIDNCEWVEGYYLYAGGKYMILNFTEKNSEIYHNMYEVQVKTICRYTGLCDKYGDKIWENDIVSCPEGECLGQINWNESEAGFYFDILLNTGNFCEESIDDHLYCMEVIGNIFDNPELLEGGAEE